MKKYSRENPLIQIFPTDWLSVVSRFCVAGPMSEVQRLEMTVDVLHNLQQVSLPSGTSQESVAIQELRTRVAAEIKSDSLPAVPPLQRSGMVAEPLERSFLRNLAGRLKWILGFDRKARRQYVLQKRQRNKIHRSWRLVAGERRFLLAVLVFLPALLAAWGVSTILPFHGGTLPEFLLIVVSGLLFSWVSVGFWVSVFGFLVLLGKTDRLILGETLQNLPDSVPENARTAILFPICGEDMSRVSAGCFCRLPVAEKNGADIAFRCLPVERFERSRCLDQRRSPMATNVPGSG